MADLTKAVLLALGLWAGCGEPVPPYPKPSPAGQESRAANSSPGVLPGGSAAGAPGGPGSGVAVSTAATPVAVPPHSLFQPATPAAGQPEPPIRAGLARMPGYRQSVALLNAQPATSDSVVRGHNLYVRACALCHGEDLKGPSSRRPDAAPRPTRDLTLAANYRYGSTDQALYRTIRYGIPRTAMGNYEKVFEPEQVWDLVNFLKSRWRAGASAPPQPALSAQPGTPASHHHAASVQGMDNR